MNVSNLQRRAFLVASATMALVVAVVAFYWQAVAKGSLPSPIQPIVTHRGRDGSSPRPTGLNLPETSLPRPDGTHSAQAPSQPATVAAREAAPPAKPVTESAAPPKVPPAPATATPAPVSAHDPMARLREIQAVQAGPTNEPLALVEPNQIIAERQPVTPARPVDPVRPSTTSQADQQLAEHWLSHAEKRPVVRVHYDPVEILRLVELGRGVIVAKSTGTAEQRELYLESKPGAAPLFAPYTRSVADRFSSYSLLLDPSLALAPLTTAFPVYFPNAQFVLGFVPDFALASEIFTQVAQASRSASVGHPPDQTVYEGQLSLEGSTPSFQLFGHQPATKGRLAMDSERGGK